MSLKYILLGVLAAAIWGGAFLVSAEALRYTPPLFLAALRFIAASAFILVVPRPKVSFWYLLLAGTLLGALQYGLLFIGMKSGAAPGIASLLVHTQIFFTIILALVVFDERLNAVQIGGMMAAFAGLALLASQRGSDVSPVGLALVMLAAVAGGVGNIVLKRIGSTDRIGIAVWMSLAPPIPLLVASAIFEGNLTTSLQHVNWVVIGAVAYTAVLSTVVAFAIWAMLFSMFPASTVSAFQLLVPVFGIALSIGLEGESFTSVKLAAVALMFIGLVTISTPVGRWAAGRLTVARTGKASI